MAYIRDKSCEFTGYQERAPYNPNIDIQCDFVMVYGTDKTMPKRIKEFKEKGYVVHVMTGIAWGEYQDYLYGRWDGREHWDEAQKDRNGEDISHGKDVPYMVPTIAFTNYLIERLKIAVDAGAEAIHLEEPEFWDYGGYSEAFKREYEMYYREKWQPPHTSIAIRYKASKLKAYLYARALDRISSALKEYAIVNYNRILRFYVPTHSLINYTQWKIMSPEGALIDLPTIDGYIAQIWTGTSRVENVYEGVLKQRTFETAYLEYGIMQELVKGTGRKMWFLHDPIEDNPEFPWEDYRYNYLKTVTASLLHPAIHTYEVCPWPNRVYNGIYPRSRKTHLPTAKAKRIPSDYRTLLCNITNVLGDMDQDTYTFDGINTGVGILMSDTGLFQRTYPDGIIQEEKHVTPDKTLFPAFFNRAKDDDNSLKQFITGGTFPHFYGMALPLLKYGLPVRPVQLDNIRRFPNYLNDYKNLILSYEYMKPASPDINNAFAAWVRAGGTLIYLGDGADPYHNIDSWWNHSTGKQYNNPAQHLFEMMDLASDLKDGIYKVGKGLLAVWNICPAKICLTAELAEKYRSFIKDVLSKTDNNWVYDNKLTLRRGPYVISAVMDESVCDSPAVLEGTYADMYTPDFAVTTNKVLKPDENTLLFDFAKVKEQPWCIVGTSARIFSFDCKEKDFSLTAKGPDSAKVFMRIKLPHPVKAAEALDENNEPVAVESVWDTFSQSVLLSYNSSARQVTIHGMFDL